MKNKTLIFFFFLTHILVFAQKSCRVTYDVEITEDFFKEEDGTIAVGYDKKINEALKTNAPNFNFSLKINNDASYFEAVKTMSNDNDSFGHKMTTAILQAKNKYYVNTSKDQKLTEVEAYGKKYIILDSINDWEITKEQKKIGNYNCYKAITKKVSLNSDGTFITDIVAWFTTELPYSFGPIGYGGLPGLILELKDDVITYRLKTIDFKQPVKISKPTDGEKVTNKELLKIGEKSNESRGW
ncbi:GLPGLI family protein [Winogradskyella wichelsiae]|uniref:GLPGLI family protein n=1 Tax=Winogradskyella wichelsiae TaxID=2697007 RepID=UPI0015C97BDD|nr:GLPGLI family protein [Winogradskyella wichelsiae]